MSKATPRRCSQSASRIDQEELAFIIGLENEIQALINFRDKVSAGVLSRLLAGESIQTGPRRASLERSTDGATHTVHLIVR